MRQRRLTMIASNLPSPAFRVVLLVFAALMSVPDAAPTAAANCSDDATANGASPSGSVSAVS